MRKLDFRLCKNKGPYQRLCFHYIDSTVPLLSKSEISICACTALFVSDLFGNHIVGFLMTRLACTIDGSAP